MFWPCSCPALLFWTEELLQRQGCGSRLGRRGGWGRAWELLGVSTGSRADQDPWSAARLGVTPLLTSVPGMWRQRGSQSLFTGLAVVDRSRQSNPESGAGVLWVLGAHSSTTLPSRQRTPVHRQKESEAGARGGGGGGEGPPAPGS